MIKLKILIMLVLVSFLVTGCQLTQFISKEAKAEDPVLSSLHPDLPAQERYYLGQWQNAAVSADEINDFEMAILYYDRIIEYFPDTKEAVYANKRLSLLMKTTGENIMKHGRPTRRRR